MNNKTQWFLGILFGFILLIFLSWQLVKNLKIKKYVENTIQSELNKFWPERIDFEIDKINFNFFSKKASVSDINFLILDGQEGDSLASVSIGKITVDWESYKNFFSNDTIKIISVNLDRVVSNGPFDFEKLNTQTSDTTKSGSKFKIQVNEITISNSEMRFYEQKPEQKGQLFTKYKVHVKDVFYDNEKDFKPLEKGIGEAYVYLDETDYYLPDGFHRLQIAESNFEPLSGKLTIKNVLFQPIYDWVKFASLKEVLSNHITFKADSISLKGMDISLEKSFLGEEIRVYQPSLTVMRDKNYILPDDRFVPIFVDKIEQMEMPVFIRKVLVENMYLEYVEKPDGKQKTGKIYFTELNGTIDNITNIADSVTKLEASLNINASTKVFGQGLLTAEITYGLQTKNGAFGAKGSLKTMGLIHFNEFLDDVFPVKIKEGQADVVYFNFGGTRTQSSGEMRFKYSNLKIEVDTKDKENNLQDNALSFLANIALAQNNPRPNGKFRVGKIEFERDTRKSMFNFWAASVVSGFKSTLGATPPAAIEKEFTEKEDENFWQKLGFGKNKDQKQ
ncbi:hypothetical protein JKA74_14775 [Marivirga sp. S37H4]|uniref:Uncharacterized protein n=1 Tax=Marivirga aurantiaca TaxID=2802615 RepID=A0A935CCU4_9BACT|nr:hypothetical protein [Marivirga aurantiaca]MBK6266308.1 hypothetical protein [Marivirga aurantiaca]